MHNSGKNPPWARSGGVSSGVQQQMLGQNMSAMSGSMMTAYPQQQMYQQGMMQGMGIGMNPMGSQQMYSGVVSYPTPRALNPNAFQGNGTSNNAGSSATNPMVKQRVFTGTVTKAHKDFGFVDEDVFFQMAVCGKGPIPKVGDRVLVEASYNANMPFKWNATRLQVMANSKASREQDGYNAVPPPSDSDRDSFRRNRRDERRRDEDEPERKRVARREEPLRRRDSPARRDSPTRRSPLRDRKLASISRFDIHLPKVTFDTTSADVFELKRRYRESAVRSLYVPSDFFTTRFRWQDAFPLYSPLVLDQPAAFHILHKSVERLDTDKEEAVLEPSDADYSYSAKVMLLSLPSMEKMYEKCNIKTEKDGNHKHSSDEGVHPTRLIKFLVGNKGKNSESFAIGGPWSPSLDGPDPENDPATLVKTAIRTCKALTGIDLSNCTQWYRFVEYYYRRNDEKRNKTWVETVVLFVPDVWSCVPSRLDWDTTVQSYKELLERKLAGPVTQDALLKQVEKGDKTISADSDLKVTPKKEETTKKAEISKKVEMAAKSDASNGEENPIDVDEKCKDDTQDGDDVVLVSETPAGLSEREKRDLKSRYTMPESPHVLVYPSSTARAGKFQAVSLSLSVLLDYRIEDAKEHSFEVFLFAELFNEMLMRDFIFNIYKALTLLPDKAEEKKDKKKSEDKDCKKDDDKDAKKEDNDTKKEQIKDDTAKIAADKKDEKNVSKETNDKKSNGDEKKDQKDERIEDEDMQVSDGEDERKSTTTEKGRGRKRRTGSLVREPLLLMSFLYFDITRAGHITSGDMEKMLSSLGLQLSRAQIKKLLAKVLVKDNFYYRRITEVPRDGEPDQCPDIGSLTPEALRELALGNRCMVPITHTPGNEARAEASTQDTCISSSGMVTYAGRVVDLEKLLSQLASSEASRRQLESRLVDLKKDHKALQERFNTSARSERNLTQDLDASKVKLNAMQMKLNRTLATTSIFHCTMKDIQTKIDAVISIPFQDDTKLSESKDVDEEKTTGVEEIKEDIED